MMKTAKMEVIFMSNRYLKVGEVAELWKVSERRVQLLCDQGRIEGAKKFGRSWMIPDDAPKPVDTRYKEQKKMLEELPTLPMPRKAPFLDMTDLYTKPGSADEVIESLADHPEAQALFAAEIAYSRGEIGKVMEHAQYFLKAKSGFYAVNAGGMLLALAAMWRGDILLWREAKVHIFEAPAKTQTDEEIMALSIACVDSAVRDLSSYPEWFTRGKFAHLHCDSLPAARVFYVKYLLVQAQDMAKDHITLPDVTGLSLLKTIPYITEPMIAQAVAEKVVIPEIYLRLLVAIAYHQCGDDQSAIEHIDRAIELALPDKLLGILAEHRRQLDYLLDDRLELADPYLCRKYKALHKDLLEGWTNLHNQLLSRSVSKALTIREREIARYAAFGMTNAQIAQRMCMTPSAAKQAVYDVMNKTGAFSRNELGAFV